MLKYIPVQVNVLAESPYYSQLAIPIKDVIINKKFSIVFGRLLAKWFARFYERKHMIINESYVELEYSHKFTKRFMPQISNDEYDLVISYLTPHYYAAEKCIGKLKIAWIHTDYAYIECDTESELHMWNRYDYIIAISETVKQNFLKKFPSLKQKMLIIENTVSRRVVEKQAAEFAVETEMDSSSIKILSIGRFCNPKNFDNIPEICNIIRNKGYDVKWYIIGFGEDEKLIRKKIAKFKMEESVIILGKKSNPYPYIKACDFYIQPSRYEGKSISVLEAQALNKPVIITNYNTAQGQLNDGIDGMIVSMNNLECAQGIIDVLEDRMTQEKLKENCNNIKFPNDFDILYRLAGIEEKRT